MRKCSQCGAQFSDNAVFCTACGNHLNTNAEQSINNEMQNSVLPKQSLTGPYQTQPFAPATTSDNRKIYSILAYISFFWLFGLLAKPEKFDSRVRFNVGQGIMATITSAACSIIAAILTAINNTVFRTEISYFGYSTGNYTTSALGSALNTLVWIAVFGITVFYMVYGIVKVSKNNDSYLPVIGKLAFYK